MKKEIDQVTPLFDANKLGYDRAVREIIDELLKNGEITATKVIKKFIKN